MSMHLFYASVIVFIQTKNGRSGIEPWNRRLEVYCYIPFNYRGNFLSVILDFFVLRTVVSRREIFFLTDFFNLIRSFFQFLVFKDTFDEKTVGFVSPQSVFQLRFIADSCLTRLLIYSFNFTLFRLV